MPVTPGVHCLPVLFLVLAAPATAQVVQGTVVQGTVADADGEPLPGANVYLSGTTYGAASNADGRFVIRGMPPGAYRVVASMLGYAVGVESVALTRSDTLSLAFVLTAREASLGTVEVSAIRDTRWERRYAWFRRQLLGETDNAAHCEILNPHVLSFRGRWGSLAADASAPLVIENRALGYRLTYDLQAFVGSDVSLRYDGDERFDELTPANADEATRWAAARETAYQGSMRHLFVALLAGTAEAEGFSLALTETDPLGYRAHFGTPERPVRGHQLVRVGDDGWGTIRRRGQLHIRYESEPEADAYLTSEWFREPRTRPARVQQSIIHLTPGDRIDPQGTPEDPFAFTVSGYMAFERLAELLPAGYRPPPRPQEGPRIRRFP